MMGAPDVLALPLVDKTYGVVETISSRDNDIFATRLHVVRDPTLNRLCVIKHIHVVSRDRQVADRVRQRVRQEARIMGSIKNPRLPHVYDLIESSNDLYIKMERVEGKRLVLQRHFRFWAVQHL